MIRYRPSARRRTSATSVRIPLPLDTCDDCLVASTACSPYRSVTLRARGRGAWPPTTEPIVPRGTSSGRPDGRSGAAGEQLEQLVELVRAGVVELHPSPAAAARDRRRVPEARVQLPRHLSHPVLAGLVLVRSRTGDL